MCKSIDQWVDFRLKRYYQYPYRVTNVNEVIGNLRIVYAVYNRTIFRDPANKIIDTKYGWAGNEQKEEFQDALKAIQDEHGKEVSFEHQYNLEDKLRINGSLLTYKRRIGSSDVIISTVTSRAAYVFAVCAPGKEEQLPASIAGFLAPNASRGLNMTYARPQHVACSGRYPGTKSAQQWDSNDISESLTDFKNQRHDGQGTLTDCQDGREEEFGTDPDDSTSYVSNFGYKHRVNADSSWDMTRKFHRWLCHVAIEPYMETQTPTDTEP